jgi:rare lipoprotein A
MIGLVAVLLLGGCASSSRFAGRSSGGGETHTDGRGSRTPAGKILLSLDGIVSFYGQDFQGKKTSNGETFDLHALTAAHRTFPFGTKVRVTNLDNGKVVIVRVNDRGPFVEGRIMDLSMGAAQSIDLVKTGTAKARLEVLEWGTGQ